MRSNRERTQDLLTKLDRLHTLIPATIEAVNSLDLEVLDQCNAELYVTSEPGHLTMEMPYNIKAYKVLRKSLGPKWKFVEKRFHNRLGSWFMEFVHQDLEVKLSIELELIGNLQGQSCQLVKVDEKVTPVYKLECDQ